MTKLCPRGKAAAKRKFKVYPSAYANAYASKICAGKIKDPSGTKRKDWGPKKMNKGGGADFDTSGSRIKPYGKTAKVKIEKLKPKASYNKPFYRREAKVGMAVTAGSQSAMGRLEKSGLKLSKGGGADTGTEGEFRSKVGVVENKLKRYGDSLKKKLLKTGPGTGIPKKKMMSGGFGIFSKKKKEEEKKSVQEENANKKKKRLEELRKEIGAKKGKMMIMIAIGKPKKASKGSPPKGVVKPGMKSPKKKAIPGDPRERHEYIRKIQNPISEYDKKGKLKYTAANKGKIMQVANKLEKASKAHAGQAKTLKSLKLSRGGGAAIRGTNFKGVF